MWIKTEDDMLLNTADISAIKVFDVDNYDRCYGGKYGVHALYRQGHLTEDEFHDEEMRSVRSETYNIIRQHGIVFRLYPIYTCDSRSDAVRALQGICGSLLYEESICDIKKIMAIRICHEKEE